METKTEVTKTKILNIYQLPTIVIAHCISFLNKRDHAQSAHVSSLFRVLSYRTASSPNVITILDSKHIKTGMALENMRPREMRIHLTGFHVETRCLFVHQPRVHTLKFGDDYHHHSEKTNKECVFGKFMNCVTSIPHNNNNNSTTVTPDANFDSCTTLDVACLCRGVLSLLKRLPNLKMFYCDTIDSDVTSDREYSASVFEHMQNVQVVHIRQELGQHAFVHLQHESDQHAFVQKMVATLVHLVELRVPRMRACLDGSSSRLRVLESNLLVMKERNNILDKRLSNGVPSSLPSIASLTFLDTSIPWSRASTYVSHLPLLKHLRLHLYSPETERFTNYASKLTFEVKNKTLEYAYISSSHDVENTLLATCTNIDDYGASLTSTWRLHPSLSIIKVNYNPDAPSALIASICAFFLFSK